MAWINRKLSDVCRLINGRAYKKHEMLSEGPYPLLRVGNFFTNRGWYYSDMELDPDKYCDNGDLLYAWSASFGPKIWDGGKVIYHYHIWKIEIDEELVDKHYLFYLLDWDKELIKSEQGAGTTMVHVTKGSMENRILPFPSLEEQKRIVAILDQAFADIDQARATAETNLKNARELFDSYLQKVFSQRGEGWVEAKLGDLLDIGSSKRIYETDWTKSGVPFFGGKEIVQLAKYGTVVSNAYISEEKYLEYASKYDMPKKGDILMTARGTIGVGYIVQEGDKFYYKDGNIISLRQKKPTNPQFILYAFKTKQVLDQIERLTGTTVNHLPLRAAKEIVLSIPNYDAQNVIVSKINEMETNIQHLVRIYEKKLLAVDELKKSILQKAFTGELTKSKGIAA